MAVTPDCLAQLGLESNPFGPLAADAPVYRDALLDGFAELAVRALGEPSALVVLAGAGGVGRSVQLQRILGDFDDQADLIAFRARQNVSFESLDATIRFQLSGLGSADSSTSLVNLFGERLRAGRVLVLAIDDAHLLATSVFDQLFTMRRQLQTRLGAAARFLMVSDPAFASNPLPGLNADEDTRVLRLHLRPFNREQTHAYLSDRLRVAGHPQPALFLKRDIVDRLHRSSCGLPKYLNAVAEDWLGEICEPVRDSAVAGSSSRASAVATESAPEEALVSTMVALEALRNASRGAIEEAASATGDADARARQSSGTQEKKHQKTAQESATRKKAAKQSGEESPSGERVAIWNRGWFVPGVAVFTLVAIFLPLLWQWQGPSAGRFDADTGLSGHQGAEKIRKQAPLAPGAPILGPPVDASPRQDEPPPQTLERPVPDTVAAQDVATPVQEGAARPDSVPESPAQPGGAGSPADVQGEVPAEPDRAESESPSELQPPEPLSDRDWLLQQPPRHFTIQLAAERTLAAAQAHARGFDGLDIHFVPTWSRSRAFVVVLVGNYPSRFAAEQAAKTLPGHLRWSSHWVRTFDSVRQSLR